MGSVEAIKKEIARRRNINSKNFFKVGSPITFEQFKHMDFIKLMELVFESDQLLNHLYNLLIEGK